MEAPTELPAGSGEDRIVVEGGKEDEIKRLKPNGGKMKELVRYKEENEKRIEREKLSKR